MNFKKITIIFLAIFVNLNQSSLVFGNSQYPLDNNSILQHNKLESLKMVPEIKEFLKLIDFYEQELTHFEVVGREKSEKEEYRVGQINKVLFHLKNILKVLRKNEARFP